MTYSACENRKKETRITIQQNVFLATKIFITKSPIFHRYSAVAKSISDENFQQISLLKIRVVLK